MSGNIRYIAVCQNDKVIADYKHDTSKSAEDYRGTVDKILTSDGWTQAKADSRSKLELTSGNSIYCVEFDGGDRKRVCIAVVAKTYPTRYVFSSASAGLSGPRLMKDIRGHIEESVGSNSDEKALKRAFKNGGFLKATASKFDDMSTLDKLAATTKKVQDVQKVMAENMVLATERDSLLSGLQVKTDELAESSKRMFQNSTALKRKSRCACLRAYALVIGIVVLLLAAAAGTIVGLNYEKYHWWK